MELGLAGGPAGALLMTHVRLRNQVTGELLMGAGLGLPLARRPIPWENVLVMMLPSGRLAYDVTRIAMSSIASAYPAMPAAINPVISPSGVAMSTSRIDLLPIL